MAGVFVAENGLGGGDAPIDAEGIIKDADASVCLRVVELVALVLEYSGFAEHSEAVGKPLRDEELAMIILSKFYGYMLAVGWAAFADINGYVQDSTFDATNEFALGKGRALKMQSAHHTVA